MTVTVTVELGDGDLGALLALYADLHPDDPPLPAPIAAARWTAILSMPGHTVLGLRDELGGLLASCVLQVVPNLTRDARPYGVLENVVVRADRRGRGLGRTVVQAALDRAWAAGCYKVMLLARTENTDAQRFYEAIGFDRDAKVGYLATPPS